MRAWSSSLLIILVAGCAYVNRSEYETYWDADGDGYAIDEDCDDDNPNVFPFAPDFRGDGCDADCGEELDSDNDDWPDVADCDPNDPDIFPCSDMEEPGDGIDHDCDGADGVRDDACPSDDPDFPETEPIARCGGGQ